MQKHNLLSFLKVKLCVYESAEYGFIALANDFDNLLKEMFVGCFGRLSDVCWTFRTFTA